MRITYRVSCAGYSHFTGGGRDMVVDLGLHWWRRPPVHIIYSAACSSTIHIQLTTHAKPKKYVIILHVHMVHRPSQDNYQSPAHGTSSLMCGYTCIAIGYRLARMSGCVVHGDTQLLWSLWTEAVNVQLGRDTLLMLHCS